MARFGWRHAAAAAAVVVALLAWQRWPDTPAHFDLAPLEFGTDRAATERAVGPLAPVEGNLGATPVDSPLVTRVQTDRRLPGIGVPATLELRFFRDQLWVVIVYPADADALAAVAERVRTTNGEPSASFGAVTMWETPDRDIHVHGEQGWVSVADRELSAEVRRAFFDAMRRDPG